MSEFSYAHINPTAAKVVSYVSSMPQKMWRKLMPGA